MNARPLVILCLVSLVLTAIPVAAGDLYVWQDSPHEGVPYNAWSNAAHTIQAAVDEADTNDTVWVTNGVYDTGGRTAPGLPMIALSNRVVITNSILVRSVNGAEHTFIVGAADPVTTNGDSAVRCVYMSAGVLSGFTLTNGHTRTGMPPMDQEGGGARLTGGAEIRDSVIVNSTASSYGGGVYGGLLRRCILRGHHAAQEGGGAYQGTLVNCLVVDNGSDQEGGGLSQCTATNCTVAGNTTSGIGGGAAYGTLINCIVYYNSCDQYPDAANCLLGDYHYCCTAPDPTGSPDLFNIITNAPLFEDKDNGDYHLQTNSPCIDRGTNLSFAITHDLEGTPRPMDGDGDGTHRFDMGAYEYDPVIVASDLAVTKTVDHTAPEEGETIAYTLGVTNLGPDDATGVEVTDVLPEGVSYLSHAGGSYEWSSGQWTVGALASGAGTSLTITATIDAGTMGETITNTATITALNETDYEPGNDTDTAVLTVYVFESDLAVTKTAAPPAPEVGDTVTYTVTVVNNGPDDATGVEITDVVPAGVTFLSATPDQGAYNNVSGEWTVGSLAVGADAVLTIEARLDVPVSLTAAIPNPEPVYYDQFGYVVAGVGSERLLVGVHDHEARGQAYLLGADGTLLTTIPYPTPDTSAFGVAVAALGDSLLIIGAYNTKQGDSHQAGNVYLYDTNGTLLVTITNPSPECSYDHFGNAVAGIGDDKVLVGAYYDDPGDIANAGSVYLFDTSGTMLRTITNPAPEASEHFGCSVAAVGNDKFLVGAYCADPGGVNNAGSAYLFDTDGTLLAAIPNPEPDANDYFGYVVAAVGSDKLLVGAWYDDPGGVDEAGSAYLFDTNGALLAAISNPDPDEDDYFGRALAGIGDDKLLVGAYQDDPSGVENAGSVYLFDTDGTLLATIPDPGLDEDDRFGAGLAGLADGRALVGAPCDDVNETPMAGMVFVLDTDGGGAWVRNSAAVTGLHQVDTNGDNSQDEATIAVDRQADVAVSKSCDRQNPWIAEAVTFTVTADNEGPEATAAIVKDVLPAGLSYEAHTASQGTYSPLSGEWHTGYLPADGTETLTIEARVTIPHEETEVSSPDPQSYEYFGYSVAGRNTGQFLVGAPRSYEGVSGAGAAYLFSAGGSHLATFTNPHPDLWDHFGNAVAFIGTDRVLIGADQDSVGLDDMAGKAHLFGTNGTLITTIVSPDSNPYDEFGCAVAELGGGKMAIGAAQADVEGQDSGSVYIFDTNGTHLLSIPNPRAAYDRFGCSLDRVGDDKILIGASDLYVSPFGDVGGAYLYDTNGTLLAAITNPTANYGHEGDDFGASVACVGDDLLLIGSPGFDLEGRPAHGQAYLFDTNGTLLVTIPQPLPELGRRFGCSVARVGTDRLLIGAMYGYTGGAEAGVAYLFDTNGVLLAAIPNPDPDYEDTFGWSVSSMDGDTLLIGALCGDIEGGSDDSGLVYVLSPLPTCTVTNTATMVYTDSGDSNPANDSASVILVAGGADLAVSKTVDDPCPNEGDTIIYTIVVTNKGPGDATGVQVTDVLPGGVTYLSDSGGGSYNPGSGLWTIGSLANGSSTDLVINASVDAGTTGQNIPNTAAITAATPADGASANDTDTVAIDIVEADPGVFRFSSDVYGIGEPDGVKTITVVRDRGSDGSATVEFVASNGTARVEDDDYVPTNGTLTFADSQTQRTFDVEVLDDDAVEGDEYVQLVLRNPGNQAELGSPWKVGLVIGDDDVETTVESEGFGPGPEAESSGVPAGWTVVTNGDPAACWQFDDPGSRGNLTGGSGGFAVADSAFFGPVDMDTELRSPEMELTNMFTVLLEFKTDFDWNGSEIADVDVSTNGAAGPWSNVWRRAGADYRGPKTETVDITSVAAGEPDVMLRFHYHGAHDDRWWQVDDVRVFGEVDDDGDGLPDWWEEVKLLDPDAPEGFDTDEDGFTDAQEFWVDTNPADSNDYLVIRGFGAADGVWIEFVSSPLVHYGIDVSSNLLSGGWSDWVTDLPGNGGVQSVPDTEDVPVRLYRLHGERQIREP